MKLNATLFVQAINFLIAYVLMRWLLFKPAVIQIQAENTEKQSLHDMIQQQKIVIEQHENIRSYNWTLCQQFFLAQKPKIDDPNLFIFKQITPSIFLSIPTRHELEQSVARVTQEIVKKVNA